MRQLPQGFPVPMSPLQSGFHSGNPLMSPTGMSGPNAMRHASSADPQAMQMYSAKIRDDPYAGLKLHINTGSGKPTSEILKQASDDYAEMERRQRGGRGEHDDDDGGCCCTIS